MSQVLRQYQTDCVNAVIDSIHNGRKRILYTAATGLGKTTILAELVRMLLEENHKILMMVHRKEIVLQIFDRVRDHCGLTYYDIGIEQNVEHAPTSCRVVVGNVATVQSPKRLDWFAPTVIITDEAHRAAAKSYLSVYKRFDVPDRCLHIGCTATAKRTDRQSLYALHIDGTPVMIEDNKGQRKPADFDTSVFEQHVYERNILDGTNDGYLVPALGKSVKTETDISQVETDLDGDFKENQLQDAVNNDPRTQKAISAWIQAKCQTRPTLIFCAGVSHAHSVAESFRDAGFKAAALDGESESEQRALTLNDFKEGHIQVLVNCGLFTEGTDIPACACIIHMRPTKSWNLYVQMTGRGLRPLPKVIDLVFDPDTGVWTGPEDALERCAAIEWSAKPDCLVLDVVDICGKHDLCALPVILDLPAKLDLQGQSVTAAKKMLDDYQDASEHLEDNDREVPLTFQKLQVRLAQIDLIRNADKKGEGWKVCDGGFRYMNVPPMYSAQLFPEGEKAYRLSVQYKGQPIFDKTGLPREKFRNYMGHAKNRIDEVVGGHSANRPKGTLEQLTPKQIRVLKRRGHSEERIDALPIKTARELISKYMQEYRERWGIA